MKTYFIDTNCFLRLLLRDNTLQFKKTHKLFQQAIKGKVRLVSSTVVFFEIHWVLKSFYKKSKKECTTMLEKVLRVKSVFFDQREVLEEALDLFKETSIDLEDCYNIVFSQANDVDEFFSFDKKALKVWKKQ